MNFFHYFNNIYTIYCIIVLKNCHIYTIFVHKNYGTIAITDFKFGACGEMWGWNTDVYTLIVA